MKIKHTMHHVVKSSAVFPPLSLDSYHPQLTPTGKVRQKS